MIPTLDSVDALDAVLAPGATDRPIVLFKHSLSCGTSAWAMEEMAQLADEPTLGADLYVVKIQAARAVSDAITTRFGIRHESPQVLLVVGDTVVWHTSHFNVTAANVTSAIGRLTTSVG